MADAEAIAEVKQNLGAEHAELADWGDTVIGARLDAGQSLAVIVASWWRYWVAQTASYVSISESGSTRDLGSINRNAMTILNYWEAKVKAEEEEADDSNSRNRIRFHRAVRV